MVERRGLLQVEKTFKDILLIKLLYEKGEGKEGEK
jgi:hypothetical protein